MEIPNRFMLPNGNQIYSEFVDFTAAFLFSLGESDNYRDQIYYHQYFLKHVGEYDGSKHEGDCTQQPFSCNQCLIDNYRDRALTMINKQAFDQYLIDEELCE